VNCCDEARRYQRRLDEGTKRDGFTEARILIVMVDERRRMLMHLLSDEIVFELCSSYCCCFCCCEVDLIARS
jgi:hypothetical protein